MILKLAVILLINCDQHLFFTNSYKLFAMLKKKLKFTGARELNFYCYHRKVNAIAFSLLEHGGSTMYL